VFANLGIHLALARNHLSEKLYIGILFLIVVGLLGAVLVGLSSDRDRLRTPAWLLGSGVCLAEFVLFLLSRTTGLPGGYHEAFLGAPEDLLGLASLFTELAVLATATTSLTTTPPGPGSGTPFPLHDRTAPLN
jgi:hypothetical protein